MLLSRIPPAKSTELRKRKRWQRMPSRAARSKSFPAGSQISSARCPIRSNSRVSPSTCDCPPANSRSGSTPATRSGITVESTARGARSLYALASGISGSSIPEPVVQNREGGSDRVAPADFLALVIGSAGVRNPHFEDPPFGARGLGSNFRFEGESVSRKLELHKFVAHEPLHPGLHVGQVQIGNRIRQQRDKPVGDVMPEKQHPMWSTQKA